MENAARGERWDIFCRVVDNYGDVGVSWRLARQLAREHGKRVRLLLDDLTVLAKLRPGIDPLRDRNDLDGSRSAASIRPRAKWPTSWSRPSAAIRPNRTCSRWRGASRSRAGSTSNT
jgi:hypothetical protein